MQSAANSLDELQASPRAAWLWDGARARIVWANAPGIAQFGGDTLFDLIDQAFDMRHPDIQRIAELCATMQRGSTQGETFSLPTAGGDIAVTCDCQIHALPDGRNGLLVVSRPVTQVAPDSPLMTGVLEAMPIAIVVVAADGRTVFTNRAAADILDPARLQTLDDLLENAATAEELIRHTLDAGTITTVRKLATRHGEREVRIISRRLETAEPAADSQILLMLEDVTERRALERSLASDAKPPAPAPPPPAPAPDRGPSGSSSGETADLSDIARKIAAIKPPSLAPEPAPASPPPPAPVPAKIALPRLPQAIANLLEPSPEAVILHQLNAVYYANPAALRLLGFDDFSDLVAKSGLSANLIEHSTPDRRLTVTTGAGTAIAVQARTSKFPWHEGVMWQSKLKLQPPAVGEEPQTAPEPEKPPAALVKLTQTAIEKPEFITPPAPVPRTDAKVEKPARVMPVGSEDAELRTIVDIAADGLVTLNESGEIVSISAGAEALFGFRLAEVAGRPFADLLHEDSRPVLRAYLASLSESGVASIFNDGREVTAVVSQGGEISLFMTINRLHSGTHASYCAVLRDITQWKKTEAELRDAIKNAEDSSAQKSEFLARISHELRTPLNAILGFSDVMRSERFGEIGNPQYLGYASDIHQSGTHLLSLINDLLDLSKIEAGKAELNFTSVDLKATTAECVRLLQNQATAARVVIRQNLSPDLPNVVADARSMKQIILNLLSNAVKFTNPGGQVMISAKLNRAGELTYRVKDTGIGMNDEELQRALEPFSRVPDAEHRKRPGTGLGLPLTRALAQANRTRFSISSERRKGTLVEITFPTTRVLAD